MRRSLSSLLFVLALSGVAGAQSKPRNATDADRLGMACTQILKMSSGEWVSSFTEKTHMAADDPRGVVRAAAAYGKCYDARTDALAASLARTGKGPNKAARTDFTAFETAMKAFADKALAEAATPPDEQKKAYAALYEKQFRREFYEEYEVKATIAPVAATATKAPSAAPPPTTQTPPSASDSTRSKAGQEKARSDADPMTQAKNHFGHILDALPDDKMHELHKAFGEVVGPYSISEQTRLAVYRYAIFLLEPRLSVPFAPPPF